MSASAFNSAKLVVALTTIAVLNSEPALGGTSPIEVIYTKIPTDPSSVVPGALDGSGNPAATRFRALEDLLMSPDGSRWIVKGRTQLGTGLENIMLIGSGKVGGYFAQSGQPVPGGTTAEKYDFFGSGLGRFNDQNVFAYSARAMGGSSSIFQKVLVHSGGLVYNAADFTLVAHGGNTPATGDLYTGLQDVSPNPVGDETIGNSIGSIHILNNGVIGSHDTTILNIHSSRRPAIFYSNPFTAGGGHVTFNAFKQVGVSTFLGLGGSPVHTFAASGSGLSSNSFYSTTDGAHWMTIGAILGAPTTSDAVLVVDGQTRLQEGSAIPGDTAVVSTIVTADWFGNDWYARGAISGGGVYAVRNGSLLVKTGQPISSTLGPSENWGTTFLTLGANRMGDVVVVGKTDNANPAIDDVVVVNGDVVMREGDPIDLDGNGQFDDNVFIGRGNNTLAAFETGDVALTDDMMLYIFVDLRDGQGNDLNSSPSFGTPQAFVRRNLAPQPLPCPSDVNHDGSVGVTDLLAVIGTWGPCPGKCPPYCAADINHDCSVGVVDLLAVIGAWGPCP